MIFIYGLFCPEKKQIRYIGKSIRPNGRYRDHINDHSNTHKVHWIQGLVKRGKKPELIILETLNDGADWQTAERSWIKKAKDKGWPLVNGTSGGDGVCDLSPESARKIREAWIGRKHKPETLIKLSNASKGRLHSDDWKRDMSEKMKGREITWGETLSKVNRKFSDEDQRKVLRLLDSGMKVKDVAEKYGVHRTTISKIKGGIYHKKYKDMYGEKNRQ